MQKDKVSDANIVDYTCNTVRNYWQATAQAAIVALCQLPFHPFRSQFWATRISEQSLHE
jgi:hypothetical protein